MSMDWGIFSRWAALSLFAALAQGQVATPSTAAALDGAMAKSAIAKKDLRTVDIDGHRITYLAADDVAIVQGDIILGTLDEIESKSARVRESAIVVNGLGQPMPWTSGIIYYTINSGVPNQQRITDAIEHWNTHTSVRLVPRTGQLSYVEFRRPSDEGRCASSAGMIGGRQFIDAGDLCDTGAMIHEIGHAAGLMHEQIRPDRNESITVLYENIDPDFASQFHQGPETVGRGYYDYDSIMHYSARAASTNRNAAMVTVPPGIPIGQNLTLSAGDIDAIERMYGVTPASTTVTTIPVGLSMVVDGETYASPHVFAWGPGQSHTISVAEQQGAIPRYFFARWSDGGAASHTITTSADRTVFAAIFRGEQRITSAVASGSGTVVLEPASPAGNGYYPTGTPMRITATPGGAERFFNWTGTDFQGTGSGLGTSSGLLRLYISADFNPNFTSDPFTTITSDPPNLEVTVDNVTYLTPVNFRWTPGSQHTVRAISADYSLTGAIQYLFNGWEDGVDGSTRLITAAEGAAKYTSSYRTQYYLSKGGGILTTSPTSADGYFDADTDVTITAVTGGSQVVQYWLGDALYAPSGGSPNTKVLHMDGHKTAYAVTGQPVAFRPVNAASYLAANVFDEIDTAVAPLEILTIFGDNVGPAAGTPGSIGSDGRVATSAGGTRVLFNNTAAPILYTSSNQTNVVVPADVASLARVTIRVERDGISGTPVLANVTPTLPAIFTADASGRGQVAIANSGPVDRGSIIVLYAGGAGLMDRSMPDGAVVGSDLPRPTGPVYVRIGGQPAEVSYAGGAPGLVYGALQVNVKVPELLLPGVQPVQLIVGNWASPPGTTITVK